ncbi:MAG: MFS transporter [Hydrogenophilaceae bacterium]|jgi:MFS family permease|nr:MFS transporter [Hydrogenophilaceae bacterium]
MATDQGAAPATRAYSLLALLTAINVLNFVDRQLLPSFANFIVPDLKLTDTEFGLLTGLFFIIFYAVAGLFMGALADLVHRPRLIAGAVGLWSALTAASGAAVNFITLAIPRALIGVGESALTPTAMSMLADRFSAARLGLAAGLYYMGVPIGAGLSLLVAGYLGPAIGWRNCFYLLGGLGLFFALMALTIRETRPKREKVHKGPGFFVLARTLSGALTASPALVATMFGGVALHWAIGAAAFDQLWFVQERGFERAEIARINGYAIVFGGIAGNIVGGWLGDVWQRHFKSGRAMLLFWMLLLTTPFNLAYRLVPPDSPFFWIGLYTGIFQLAAFYGPTFSAVQELAPPQARATVTAFYILLLNTVGLGLGITMTGVLIDQFRAAGSEQPYSAAILAFTVIGALAAPAFFLAGRWFKRDLARNQARAAAAVSG